LARIIRIGCVYGILGRETTKYAVLYSVNVRFWPTLRTTQYTKCSADGLLCETHVELLPFLKPPCPSLLTIVQSADEGKGLGEGEGEEGGGRMDDYTYDDHAYNHEDELDDEDYHHDHHHHHGMCVRVRVCVCVCVCVFSCVYLF